MDKVVLPEIAGKEVITKQGLEELVVSSAEMYAAVKSYLSSGEFDIQASSRVISCIVNVYSSVRRKLNGRIGVIPKTIDIDTSHSLLDAAEGVLLQASVAYSNWISGGEIKVVRDLYRMVPNLGILIYGSVNDDENNV